MTNFDDPTYRLARAISDLAKRVKELESADNAIFEIKTTLGDPVSRGEFHFVINTSGTPFLKVWADGAWRTLWS